MLRVQLYHQDHHTQSIGGIELLDHWVDDSRTRLWMDIDGPLDESLQQLLQERLGLHPLALSDAARDRHPPKIEDFDTHTFMIFKGLSTDAQTIDCTTIQVALFVGERFLVTRHSGESRSISRLREALDEDLELFDQGPDAMAVRVVRSIVDRYLRILLELEPRLEYLEDSLLGESADEILSELVVHKSNLTRLQRFFHYHTQLLRDLKSSQHPGFHPDAEHDLIDVYEHQERLGSLCALYYQLASDLIEGYISVSSHRLNQIMRVLTIITAIFVPLGFLAGVYGMNFDHMPELHSRWGYFTLLAIMGSVATVLLLAFRRKRWL
ncbi:MAG: magnesium/cobalt transporter CorA [Gammaproteobacteria bacterium]